MTSSADSSRTPSLELSSYKLNAIVQNRQSLDIDNVCILTNTHGKIIEVKETIKHGGFKKYTYVIRWDLKNKFITGEHPEKSIYESSKLHNEDEEFYDEDILEHLAGEDDDNNSFPIENFDQMLENNVEMSNCFDHDFDLSDDNDYNSILPNQSEISNSTSMSGISNVSSSINNLNNNNMNNTVPLNLNSIVTASQTAVTATSDEVIKSSNKSTTGKKSSIIWRFFTEIPDPPKVDDNGNEIQELKKVKSECSNFQCLCGLKVKYNKSNGTRHLKKHVEVISF